MKISLLVCVILSSSMSFGQTFNIFYASLADSCKQDSITQNLIAFENLGIKELGTTAIDNAHDWLVNAYTSYGYTDIVTDAFIAGGPTAKNLIITKTGTVYPNTFVIIDAHYDTKNGPGANDNGSGTVLLMELARLLVDVPTEYSIKFIHFSGEEDGLLGSQHYVNNDVIANNMDIRVVFNIDQVGGVAGMVNNTIICEMDQSPPSTNDAASAIATGELANNIQFYSTLSTDFYFAFSSDYVPFMNNDEIITGLYEDNETPYSHTSDDLIVNMDIPYLYQVIKGSMGALAHFAIAYEEVSISELDKNAVSVYPIPSNGNFTISTSELIGQEATIAIYDISGKMLWTKSIAAIMDKEQVQVEGLNSGSYLLTVESNGQFYRRKIIIE